MKNLSDLSAFHNDLDEMFFSHRSALLNFEFDAASSLCGRHGKRETGIFYPELDRVTTDA
jgi:hypothetical protein